MSKREGDDENSPPERFIKRMRNRIFGEDEFRDPEGVKMWAWCALGAFIAIIAIIFYFAYGR